MESWKLQDFSRAPFIFIKIKHMIPFTVIPHLMRDPEIKLNESLSRIDLCLFFWIPACAGMTVRRIILGLGIIHLDGVGEE
ncbi:hypothetical protein A3I42_02670 [Candidatus Uhrbacteria bacterium RIFCSPLOWO2_02_FULL_49_11]|uniref:Uncharacterized protein n=1 Tax=Candidatus Uhrbacteria bacterium RIFCSPLOWO2_02_FULL_49_11 TaxID=1802409 RepID=A0A1F7VEN2_9BACT|nr:MAG: hypothetical protein A3I42_02670 [Candidatus Uhrbacteria bacterium RIFCSPLOWO2_02_FULL_49_11]